MEWYWIVLITILTFNTIGVILLFLEKDDGCMIWCGGIILLITKYPINMIINKIRKIKQIKNRKR
jgi:hypothetical protein